MPTTLEVAMPYRLTQWHICRQTKAYSTSTSPPPPRPYNAAVHPPRVPRPPKIEIVEPDLPPPNPGLFSRIFPRQKPIPLMEGTPDPVRGQQATERVVKSGVLDPRYKRAATLYTRLIVAGTISIGLGYELWRRRFLGVKKKEFPEVVEKKVEETEMG